MNILNEYFDKIYCINLDRREDRWTECEAIFNKFNLDVERISAFDGVHCLDLGYGKVYNSELAGSISHYRTIKKAMDLNLKNVLILEDDVEFYDTLEKVFEEVIKELPTDWDMLFFGGNHTGGMTKITEQLGRVYRTFALHCYAVNNKSMKVIYENMIQYVGHTICCNTQLTPSVAADYFMSKLQPHMNVYSIFPNLSWQRESFSDIQQDMVKYDFLK